MSKYLLLLFSTIICFITFSCAGDSKDISGYVVGKEFIPMHEESYFDPALKIRRSRIVPDSYVLFVADSCEVFKVKVSRFTFFEYKKGEHIIVCQ